MSPTALWKSASAGLKTMAAAKALELELTYVNASISYHMVRVFSKAVLH